MQIERSRLRYPAVPLTLLSCQVCPKHMYVMSMGAMLSRSSE